MQNQQKDPEITKSKKIYWKFVLKFLGIILVVFIAFPIAFNYYQDYKVKKGFKDYFQAEKEYLEALKNDTFGGKTPQETYEKFIETLKTGNILDSAKFYFYDEEKIKAYQRFEQMQKDGSLANWIAELPNWSELKEVDYWDKDGKEFNYEYIQKEDYIFYEPGTQSTSTVVAGKYQARIIFEISRPNEIWKIYEL